MCCAEGVRCSGCGAGQAPAAPSLRVQVPAVLPQSTGGGAPGRKRKGGGFGVVGGAAGEGGGCEVVTPKGGGTPHQLRSVEARGAAVRMGDQLVPLQAQRAEGGAGDVGALMGPPPQMGCQRGESRAQGWSAQAVGP